jgi:hypothetical protein
VEGVQFHPESVLTEYGYRMVDRFLRGDGSRPAELPAGADGRAASSGDAAGDAHLARWYVPAPASAP